MKCSVPGCENESHQGGGFLIEAKRTIPKPDGNMKGDGTEAAGFGEHSWICAPCWNFIRSGVSTYSQVERNVPFTPPVSDMGYWDSVFGYPPSDWKYEVASNETRQGYWEWVRAQQERDGAA
jgi:hypothetical protein